MTIKLLNNWLCKTFDDNKKHYVTLGDVESKILEIIIDKIEKYGALIYITFVMFLVSSYMLILFYGTNLNTVTLIDFFMSMITGWKLFIIDIINFIILMIKAIYVPAIVMILVSYIVYKTSKVKIAKCPSAEEPK